MKKYETFAKDIVRNVGGPENVQGLTHCVTRLRFVLKDETKANKEVLENMDKVISVIQSGGQYQVVVGNIVESVFDEINEQFGFNESKDQKPSNEKQGIINILMSTISSILMPTLGVLTAAGITKGLVGLFATLGWLSTDSGAYMILYALGDGFFYFLPIMLGFTAARRFKCNEFIGAGIGAALVYPAMVNIGTTLEVSGSVFAGTVFQMDYYNTFFGIPVVMPGAGYASSVVPIILAVYVASKIEKWCKKSIPDLLKGIFTPLITLICGVVLTYLLIGPISMFLCGCISTFVTFLYEIPMVGGIIAGALVGGGFGILVMFGLHWVLISLALGTIATQGFDYMMACGSIGPMVGMIQGLAICWCARNNRKIFDLALPATVSQICGVGEPLMYSVLIPLKTPFYLNIAAGAVGGAVMGVLKTKMYAFGGSALFSFPNFVNATSGMTDMMKYCIGIAAAGIFVVIVQIMTWKKSDFSQIK